MAESSPRRHPGEEPDYGDPDYRDTSNDIDGMIVDDQPFELSNWHEEKRIKEELPKGVDPTGMHIEARKNWGQWQQQSKVREKYHPEDTEEETLNGLDS